MIECACKGCKERVLGCHATCEKYKKFRGEMDEINDKKKKHQAIENDCMMQARRRAKLRRK